MNSLYLTAKITPEKVGKKVLKICFLCFGLLYTFKAVLTDISHYQSHPSTISQRDGEHDISFPIITVCPNSQHSLKRVNQHYPSISSLDLDAFYGQFLKLENMTRLEWADMVESGELLKVNLTSRYPSWNDVNQIDLNEFYQKTRPE